MQSGVSVVKNEAEPNVKPGLPKSHIYSLIVLQNKFSSNPVCANSIKKSV